MAVYRDLSEIWDDENGDIWKKSNRIFVENGGEWNLSPYPYRCAGLGIQNVNISPIFTARKRL